MINPTIGRIVWLHGASGETIDPTEPMSAQIVHVFADRKINVAYWDHNGNHHTAHGVPLLQDEDAIPSAGIYCVWMPYQKTQAEKHATPPAGETGAETAARTAKK